MKNLSSHRCRTWLAGFLACCAMLLSGCARERPNVVLITVDTLRADRLGSYGADSQTPEMDRLASEGAVFLNAASPMPSTRPAHFSLLASRYPRDHGVTSNALALAPEIQTLPEILLADGYRTGGFTGVAILAKGSGAARGFETFDAPRSGARPAGEVIPQALEWLESDEQGPFFLWVHVYDPHMPYGPPDGVEVETPPELASPAFSRAAIWPHLERHDGNLSRHLYDYALALYRAEVEYTDRQLGRLFDALRQRSDFERTAIVLTADHGECFENGFYFEHGGCLGDGATRIPLILRYPPAVPAQERIERQVELIDVAPTLLEIATLKPPAAWAGQSLLAADSSPERERPAFIQHTVWSERALRERRSRREVFRSIDGMPVSPIDSINRLALRTPSWKYHVSPMDEALYDLRTDPEERRNVASTHRETVAELRARLRRWLADHPTRTTEPAELDRELEKTLESLGYL
ncbi:MAG: sulfatase [Acidobacteriota bacterium]